VEEITMRCRRPLTLVALVAIAAAAGCGTTGSSHVSMHEPSYDLSPKRYTLTAGDAVGQMLYAPVLDDDLGDSRFANVNTRSNVVLVPTE